MRNVIWFWRQLFLDFNNHNKLWVIIHGIKPFMTFVRVRKERKK